MSDVRRLAAALVKAMIGKRVRDHLGHVGVAHEIILHANPSDRWVEVTYADGAIIYRSMTELTVVNEETR